MKGLQYLKSLEEWNARRGMSLDRVVPVLKSLGNPQNRVPCIHVGGTNGKGSVATYCAAIMASTGARVGLTTSPHLSSVNERVVIDGLAVGDALLDEKVREIKGIGDNLSIELSFFEIVICASFLIFDELKVDWAIVEVGLGGRFDATNVIEAPAATGVVTVDFDHQALLGDSLYKIAREKAAIARAGVPMVLGPLGEDALRGVDDELREVRGGVPLIRWGREYRLAADSRGQSAQFFWQGEPTTEFQVRLPGAHQVRNGAVALALARAAGMNDLSRAVDSLRQAFWPGRLERVSWGRGEILLDGAHNEAGVEALVDYLKHGPKVRLCFGVLADKEWRVMVKHLAPFVAEWLLVDPPSSRALRSSEIAHYLSSPEINVSNAVVREYGGSIDDLVRELERDPRSPSVVAGSLYLIGAVRTAMNIASRPLWMRGDPDADRVCVSNGA